MFKKCTFIAWLLLGMGSALGALLTPARATSAAKELSIVTAQIVDNKVQISIINKYITNIHNNYELALKKLRLQRGLFLKSVSVMYKLHQKPKELLLLGDHSKDKILTSFVVFNYFLNTTLNNIKLIYLQVDHIKDLIRQLQLAKNRAHKLNDNLLTYKKKLDHLLTKHNLGGFSPQESTIFFKELQYNKLQAHRTSQLINSVSDPLRTKNDLKQDKMFYAHNYGGMYLPKSGYVYRTFHDPRYKDHLNLTYNGLVFLALPNSQIVAPAKAKVLYIGKINSYSTVILLQHSPSWISIISGDLTPCAELAQELNKGEPVATVGSNSVPVYMELDHNYKPTDLSKWYAKLPS